VLPSLLTCGGAVSRARLAKDLRPVFPAVPRTIWHESGTSPACGGYGICGTIAASRNYRW
jgi:hypothetical protein